MRRLTGARESYSALASVANDADIIKKREGGETILIGLENRFGSIKLKMPPSQCLRRFRPLGTRALHVLKLCALNPTDISWAAFN